MEIDDFEDPLAEGEDGNIFGQFLVSGGAPAFVARGAQTEEAFRRLLKKCEKKRYEWLEIFRLRLATLKALAGDWENLSRWCNTRQLVYLQQLHREFKPQLRIPREQTSSPRVLEKALQELQEAIYYFNNRWKRFLQELDLSKINELREKYNEYYLLEKECVVRSPFAARRQFEELEPVTPETLLAQFPLLPQVY